MLRAILLASLCASATAFMPPKSAVVAPRKAPPPALSKSLELRGGGIISKETYLLTTVLANVPFGLQFLLIPKMFLTMFFDNRQFDDLHIFLARFMGVLILGQSALLKVCPADIAFPIAAVTQLAVALVGPIYAQMYLKPKMPIHLFPVIVVSSVCLLSLLAM